MNDPPILTVRPREGEYAWTFGGAAPVTRIEPRTFLDVYTEDCFAGRVRSEKDLVSSVCEFPFLNPQTGPFHVVGAEPGDTVAVHFVSVEPARDWAASTTVPLSCGVAVECAMNTVVLVELLKGVTTPWPRIESDTHLMSIGSARPLEDALRISQLDLVQLARDYGLSELDAYQLVSQAGEAPLANVCDTNYTCVAKIRKEWLPAGDPHRGHHRHLRETATLLPSP
ncbi:acetamidase/formamidase family protein [Streptomyces atratus]|uniref:Acetamidase n=1 Tax=Streptomyces atratus TaxID=1893 RepID=A0A2Z5JPK9_STRAR|nr:acetamidase/formamidase family protein [Streptomyces atratus]AXE82179.1 hypothetical protein C5746_40890 [Streptomyces atratus]